MANQEDSVDWRAAAQRQAAYFRGERYQERLRVLATMLGKPVEQIDAAVTTLCRGEYHGMASYDVLDMLIAFHQKLEVQQPVADPNLS